MERGLLRRGGEEDVEEMSKEVDYLKKKEEGTVLKEER